MLSENNYACSREMFNLTTTNLRVSRVKQSTVNKLLLREGSEKKNKIQNVNFFQIGVDPPPLEM